MQSEIGNICRLFFFFKLCWVFVAVRPCSLVPTSNNLWGLLWLWRFSCCRVWALGRVIVAHGLNCPAACGILPEQGLNQCSLNWQVDS